MSPSLARARFPKVGDRVVAVRDLWDWLTAVTIPAGTLGTVTAVGIDAPFGLANITFDYPDTTPGLPLFVDPAAHVAYVDPL